MEDLIRVTRQIFDDKYPTANVVLLAGSLLRGAGTPYSDLDLVVIFDQLPHAWRESFEFQGYPVEAFVHDPETLNYPDLHSRFRESFEQLFAAGRGDKVITLAEEILRRHGGFLFDGYKKDASPACRKPLEVSD